MAQQRPPPVVGDRPGDIAEAVQVGQMPASAATPTSQADAGRPTWRVWQARLAQLILAVSVCLWVAAAALGFSRARVVGVASFGSGEVVASLVLLTFVGVGILIVTRRPGNRIGWLFCAIGLPVLLGSFATQYAVVALLVGRPALPAGPAMAWLAGWGRCCVAPTQGRLKANLRWDQIAKTSSSTATATRRLVGSSTASS